MQVWDDDANHYVDVVLNFDQWAVGFRHAQLGDTPAEYDDPGEAWRDAVDLQERFGDAIITLFDTSTGERHFDERSLPEVCADAVEATAAPEIWTDDWIIQRAVRIRAASAGGDVYEPWPGVHAPDDSRTGSQGARGVRSAVART